MDKRIAPPPGTPRPRALVTGGTSGIGRATATALAAAGWQVTITGRQEAALADAWAGVNAVAGIEACDTLRLDLADLDATRDAAAARRDHGRPLDLLVCNAGIMAPPSRMDGNGGYELQLTVNHLAHYVLAAKLLPLLRLSPAGRIVWVSSIRHHQARPRSASHGTRNATTAGRPTRRRRRGTSRCRSGSTTASPPTGVRSVAAHPGWSRTALQSRGPLLDGGTPRARRQVGLTKFLAQSAGRGAIPVMAAATGPIGDKPTYLGPSGPLELRGGRAAAARVSGLAADERWQAWVAGKSAELTGTALPA